MIVVAQLTYGQSVAYMFFFSLLVAESEVKKICSHTFYKNFCEYFLQLALLRLE